MSLANAAYCVKSPGELTALRLEDTQQREEYCDLADHAGKGGLLRIIPVPDWAKVRVNGWTGPAGITTCTLLHSITKAGRIWGNRLQPQGNLGVVKKKVED